MQAQNPIAARGKLEVVCDQHGGQGMFALQRLQQRKDAFGGGAVQITCGLICK